MDERASAETERDRRLPACFHIHVHHRVDVLLLAYLLNWQIIYRYWGQRS